MKHRALFIGGPLDGQERVLQVPASEIKVSTRLTTTLYRRLFAFNEPHEFVYSVWDVAETLNYLWTHYARRKHAPHVA